MKGIVIATHGEFANGIVSTCRMFFGELEQLVTVCLAEGEDPDEYANRILEAVQSVDTGDGVTIFCDIAYGTPCNSVIRNFKNFDLEKVDVIAGLNFPMLLQYLSSREDLNIEEVLKAGQTGIIDVKALFKK